MSEIVAKKWDDPRECSACFRVVAVYQQVIKHEKVRVLKRKELKYSLSSDG